VVGGMWGFGVDGVGVRVGWGGVGVCVVGGG